MQQTNKDKSPESCLVVTNDRQEPLFSVGRRFDVLEGPASYVG